MAIEAMAAQHLRELQKVQPHGPYRLGGFCAGGIIALEMAQALVRAGETIERLVLVDSVNPNAPFTRWRPLIDRIAPPSTTREQFARRHALLTRLTYYLKRMRMVRAMRAREVIRWATNTVRIRFGGARPATSTPIRVVDDALLADVPAERKKNMFYFHSACAYVPRRYFGAAELVFSSDPFNQATTAEATTDAAPEPGSKRVEQGWKFVFPAARVHRIEGSHIGIIVEHLDELAARLRVCLGIATSTTSAP